MTDTRFKVGHPGGPGRPKGSRHKLTEDFLADLAADWELAGMDALVACRTKHVEVYCRIVASLIPKELKLELGENLVAILGRLNGTRALEPPTLEVEPEDVRFGSPGGNA